MTELDKLREKVVAAEAFATSHFSEHPTSLDLLFAAYVLVVVARRINPSLGPNAVLGITDKIIPSAVGGVFFSAKTGESHDLV